MKNYLWIAFLGTAVTSSSSSQKLDNCEACDAASDTLHPRSVPELWAKLDCDSVLSRNRPILIQKEWEEMRNAYLKVSGIEDASSVPNKRGLHPAIVADYAGEKGRGLFATALIRKGEMIWESTQTRSFDDKETFFRFLEAINQDYACDVLEWIYMAKRSARTEEDIEIQWDENDEVVVHDFDPSIFILCIDLDDGSLANTILDYEYQDERDFNAYTVSHGGCHHTSYALRDIEEGEEILESYLDFSYPLNPQSL